MAKKKHKGIKREELTFELIDELIEVNLETSEMFWKKRDIKWFNEPIADCIGSSRYSPEVSMRVFNTRFVGKPALNALHKQGYLWGSILGTLFLAHTVIWIYAYGKRPEGDIDHIDGDKSNNLLSNLRDVPHKINCRNRASVKNESTGKTGVHLRKDSGKFVAYFNDDDGRKHVGTFECKEEAQIELNKQRLAAQYHKNHARKMNDN